MEMTVTEVRESRVQRQRNPKFKRYHLNLPLLGVHVRCVVLGVSTHLVHGARVPLSDEVRVPTGGLKKTGDPHPINQPSKSKAVNQIWPLTGALLGTVIPLVLVAARLTAFTPSGVVSGPPE